MKGEGKKFTSQGETNLNSISPQFVSRRAKKGKRRSNCTCCSLRAIEDLQFTSTCAADEGKNKRENEGDLDNCSEKVHVQTINSRREKKKK